MFPEARWIGALLVILGALIFIFDIHVEHGHLEVGQSSERTAGRVRGVGERFLLVAIALIVGLGCWSAWHFYDRQSTPPPIVAVRERMPDGHGLYQNGKIIGRSNKFSYDRNGHAVVFESVTLTGGVDFSERILFRDAVLHCPQSYPAEIIYGDHPSELYFRLHCNVATPDAELD